MTTLDDKILGEKTHYYCSSSEDEQEDDKCVAASCSDARYEGGSSTNTGPKGVIKDWQRYKQLEIEKREEQEQERVALMKKLSLTCKSLREDEEEKSREEKLDNEIEALLDDKILEEFKMKRMAEMIAQATKQPRFGKCIQLRNGQEFLEAVEEEKSTNVFIYIYKDGSKLCKIMYACLEELAKDYPQVKFCSMEVALAGMSKHFEKSGVPALLVYKNGCLIGNFVRLADEFDENFVTGDIENYLIEHGLLPENDIVPTGIRSVQYSDDL